MKFIQDTVIKAVGQAMMAQVVGMSDNIKPTNLNDIGSAIIYQVLSLSDCIRGASLPTTLPLNIATCIVSANISNQNLNEPFLPSAPFPLDIHIPQSIKENIGIIAL